VEIDEGLRIPEYRVNINQEKIKRLSINATDIASTLRAGLEGIILYEFPAGDEEIDVRLTTVDRAKDNIEKVLSIPVENQGNYLVPVGDVVWVEEVSAPNAVFRKDMKRSTIIYSDIVKKSGLTPLGAAEYLENEIFPNFLSKYPTTNFSFVGEIQDTRESTRDLFNATLMAVVLIYIVLAILFQSMLRPFIIMLAIPFGVVGVILTFWLHGKTLFGFYAAIGMLGLAGVVINDSIIMLVKLKDTYDNSRPGTESNRQIAQIAKTRLRAVVLTTLTTIAGILPTAYGFAGYDAMLSEMMLALAWGLLFGTLITLLLVPGIYSVEKDVTHGLVFAKKRKLTT
jgi:multidrug efflux pump subunit AcrB